jgi:hypothetical protein
MQHPFVGDLSALSLDELQAKIQELTKNLTFVYRTGNQNLVNQLHMVLDSYKAEASKRLDAMYKKQNIQDRINIQKSNNT